MIGALAVHRGEADALICGLEGRFDSRLDHIRDIIGLAPGAKDFAALSLVIAATGAYFLADTHVRYDPSAEEIADMAIACAHHVRRFGIEPKIALISHSDFGSADTPSAPEDARGAGGCSSAARPTSKSTARCRPTRRCPWSRASA